MSQHSAKVKLFLLELGFCIVKEDNGVFIAEKPENGIANLILACQEPILIIEQVLCKIAKKEVEVYKKLLQKNRDIIHGAFAIELDSDGEYLLFRDTLQIENLDFNELEATLNSLELLLSEYSSEIIDVSKP